METTQIIQEKIAKDIEMTQLKKKLDISFFLGNLILNAMEVQRKNVLDMSCFTLAMLGKDEGIHLFGTSLAIHKCWGLGEKEKNELRKFAENLTENGRDRKTNIDLANKFLEASS